jgi:hypothetical protein
VMHLMVGCRSICFKTDKFSEIYRTGAGKVHSDRRTTSDPT